MKYLKLILVLSFFIACQTNHPSPADTSRKIEKPSQENSLEPTIVEDERDLKDVPLDSLRDPNHYYYLNDLSSDSLGKLILSGDLKPLDNKVTFRLLDTLKYIEGNQLDFYLRVFDRILDQADGALSEVMGRYCLAFISNQPEVFRSYLSNKDSLVIRKWAEFSVYEMYFRFPEDSLMQRCSALNQSLANPDSLLEIKYFQKILRYEAQNLLKSGY